MEISRSRRAQIEETLVKNEKRSLQTQSEEFTVLPDKSGQPYLIQDQQCDCCIAPGPQVPFCNQERNASNFQPKRKV